MEVLLLASVVFFLLLIRLLKITSTPEPPKLYFKDPCSWFVKAMLKNCPILTSVYSPTILWGKSGHFQTVVHVKMGRVKPHWPDGKRYRITMPDGATMSYDLFDPHVEGIKGRFILALCPGIANSSECIYLRTFTSYAQTFGYNVAVLNHLGALKSETLTAPRIFTYGGTEEYGRMVDHLLELYPDSKIIAVGFSMGGNIVTKYLGENDSHQDKVLCGVSVCQGYEVNEAKTLFMQLWNMRRVYIYLMTLNQRYLLSRHRHLLFSEEAQKICGAVFNVDKVFRATSMVEIDDNYSCIRAGFSSVYDYYKWCSSAYYMQNIRVPMLFMNAEDDPLGPPSLLRYPKKFAETCDNCIFMTTKHGGHLGYFEGGILQPNNITWLDRAIIEYADAVISLYVDGHLTSQPDSIACSDCKENTNNEQICFPNELEEIIGDTKNPSSLHKRLVESSSSRKTADGMDEPTDKQKSISLKKGTIFKQATSYVQ